MAKVNVIVELRHQPSLAAAAFSTAPDAAKTLDPSSVPKIAGVSFDPTFAPAALPGLVERTAETVPYVSGQRFDLSLEPESATYIVRATVDENKVEQLAAHAAVVGVFADVEIQPTPICPGSPPLGNAADVERLLCTSALRAKGLDGTGVLLAIVDTGINLAHLAARGRPITLDAARSWVPGPSMTPGAAPVGHGTMCAFDASLAAPKATFLDIQLLRSTAGGPSPMSGVLSDAVRAYGHLCNVMLAPRRPGELRSLVVNNSWGMFHPSWDFPVGHPGNYSDNPNHPFNRIVAALEAAGADILFAAGNCGPTCPDGRCQGVTANAIYGANGHPAVLTIGGVDTTKAIVGYSTRGPGRLSRNKPDLCGFTHFQGSGVYAADGGTSAATPVVAGVVAAVRTRMPHNPGNPAVSPAAVRTLMRSTCQDLGAAGFDFDYGFGVVNGCEVARRFRVLWPFDRCQRYPWLCRLDRFERLDRPIPLPEPLDLGAEAAVGAGSPEDLDFETIVERSYAAGFEDGRKAAPGATSELSAGKKGCGCSGS
ncbi:MAG: S8 family serine peptidase [Thermoanaerobaculia bacterium]|nr:S8 family serine peptidase [Thermoanaerobaculia bacterium]